jgi:hypothetical protein
MMDILAQALDVVEQAEHSAGRVTLTLDLAQPSQRAAFAAAMAVLRVNGVDLAGLPLAGEGEVAPPALAGAESLPSDEAADAGDDDAEDIDDSDQPVRRAYADALAELTSDEKRRARVLRETFPRVRELLRNGANVEAVAQVQYRRWIEEGLDVNRN